MPFLARTRRGAGQSSVHPGEGHGGPPRGGSRLRTKGPQPGPRRRIVLRGLLWTAAAGVSIPLFAQEWRPQIRMAPHLFVTADILGVGPEGTVRLGGGTIEAGEAKSGTGRYAIDFSAGANRISRVEVRISEVTISEAGLRFSVASAVDVTSARKEPVRIERSREAALSEGGSCLHQVYEDPASERSIVLTLTAESRTVPEVAAPSASARTIVFQVALSRAAPDGSASPALETDILRTFDGSPVSYSFDTAARRLELTLTPSVSSENVLLVEATLRGAAGEATGAGADERRVLVHKTQVLSRGNGFDLTVQGAKGEPTYVFNVRAEF